MLRREFQTFKINSFHFLYVTDKTRIDTDVCNGLVLEPHGFLRLEPIDMSYYLNLPDD